MRKTRGATPGDATPRLTGQLLAVRLEFLKDQEGSAGIARVLRALDEADRRALQELERELWYPAELLMRLDHAIADVFAPGDPGIYERLGEASARRRTTWLRELGGLVSVHAFLSTVADENLRFQSFGRAVYRRTGFTRGNIAFSHYPPQIEQIYCHSARGYLRQAVSLLTAAAVSCEERVCQFRGDPACVFHLKWQAQRKDEPPVARHAPE